MNLFVFSLPLIHSSIGSIFAQIGGNLAHTSADWSLEGGGPDLLALGFQAAKVEYLGSAA